jgi:stearoyl-CoA desaturase (delta-9 desaturase)
MNPVQIPTERPERPADERLAWFESLPFIVWHALPLSCFFIGDVSWVDWALCGALYFVRMFGITAGYHRYFSHRAYKMGRVMQFLMALLGSLSVQKGVLWWAAHHRYHHKHSDEESDIHSPVQRGFWWAHAGWFLCTKYDATELDRVKDLARYPELVWLNRYWAWVNIAVGIVLFAIGGWGMLMIGGFLSTVFLWHGTFTINSLSHVWGSKRYEAGDTSRNNFWLALLTLGEGWHNNHHYYQGSANQGFFWWEIDISYYLLKGLELLGLVSDLRRPPQRVLDAAKPPPAIVPSVEPHVAGKAA